MPGLRAGGHPARGLSGERGRRRLYRALSAVRRNCGRTVAYSVGDKFRRERLFLTIFVGFPEREPFRIVDRIAQLSVRSDAASVSGLRQKRMHGKILYFSASLQKRHTL